jgi:hypothetical protein
MKTWVKVAIGIGIIGVSGLIYVKVRKKQGEVEIPDLSSDMPETAAENTTQKKVVNKKATNTVSSDINVGDIVYAKETVTGVADSGKTKTNFAKDAKIGTFNGISSYKLNNVTIAHVLVSGKTYSLPLNTIKK